MSRLMSSTAIIFALALGATANTASAGNGSLIAQLRDKAENRSEIEQHRDSAQGRHGGDVMRGWAKHGRYRMRADQAASNNTATTDQQGQANLATVTQFGQNLTATLAQNGTGNTATVRQFGRGNTTAIAQTGDNNAACVIQIGRNLDTGLTQTGNESTGLLQTKRGTREIPVELCNSAATATRRDLRFALGRS
ncbi:MAG: hypothetical protein HOP13_12190 [Alphaproteobacteria bacterium]|nr:hypothetical protein [Alphaproteobacteria bacterium]